VPYRPSRGQGTGTWADGAWNLRVAPGPVVPTHGPPLTRVEEELPQALVPSEQAVLTLVLVDALTAGREPAETTCTAPGSVARAVLGAPGGYQQRRSTWSLRRQSLTSPSKCAAWEA
jgi:hypothetical protein